MTCTLRLVGLPVLLRNGGDILPLHRRDAALLARLVLDGPTRRSTMAAWLWPDAATAAASSNLRQRMFRLRRWAVSAVIRSDHGVLRIAEDCTHDLADAESVLATDAEALRGDLLQDVSFDDDGDLALWLQSARENWARRRAASLTSAIAAYVSESRPGQALAHAQRLIDDEPWSEHGYRRMIELLLATGDAGGARSTLRRCGEAMQLLADTKPSADITQLVETAERVTSTPEPPRNVNNSIPREARIAMTATPALRGTPAPLPLVGRARDLLHIENAWHTAPTVLLVGEPGLGKTRLAAEIVLDRRAVQAAARPGDANVPYALLERLLLADGWPEAAGSARTALADLIQAAISTTNEGAPGAARRSHRIRRAFERLCTDAAAAGIRCLALDDLHYADAASIEALQAIASVDTRLKGLWTSRAGEEPEALQRLMASMGPRLIARLVLEPLDLMGAAALIAADVDARSRAARSSNGSPTPPPDRGAAADDDLAASLHRHCGGNPLFMIETLRLLAGVHPKTPGRGLQRNVRPWPVPIVAARLLDDRVAALSVPARQLAQALALVDNDVDDPVFAATTLLETTPLASAPQLAELDSAAMLREGRFAHDLIRDACVRSLPGALRRHWHGQVADMGLRTGMRPAHVAFHAAEGGRWTLAARQYLKAADYARVQCDPQLEAQLAEQASECHVRAGDAAGRFSAEARRLDAMRWYAPLDRQLAQIERLHACAGTDDERAQALQYDATVQLESYADARILDAIERARGLRGRRLDEIERLHLGSVEAHALGRAKRTDDALKAVSRHLPAARVQAAKGGRLGPFALGHLGCGLMYANRFREARGLFEEALASAERGTDLAARQEALMHLAWADAFAGDIAKAARDYEMAFDLARAMGYDSVPSPIARCILARTYKELGRFDEALTLLWALREEYPDHQSIDVLATCDADLADVLLWLGDVDGAAAVLRPISCTAPVIQRFHATVQGRLAVARGEPAAAMTWLDRALMAAEAEGMAFGRLAVQAERAALLPPLEGARLAEAEATRSESLELELTTWPLRLAACRAWLAAGEDQRACDAANVLACRFVNDMPFGTFAPAMWATIADALSNARQATGAAQARAHAALWIERASACVPPHHKLDFDRAIKRFGRSHSIHG